MGKQGQNMEHNIQLTMGETHTMSTCEFSRLKIVGAM